jgi:N-acetylmuramoyl-L-alanine amidase
VSPTSQNPRLRRQLLDGVVDENLDTINGRPLGSAHRRRQRRATRLRRATLTIAAVVVAGVAVAALFSTGAMTTSNQGAPGLVRELEPSKLVIPAPSPRGEVIARRLEVADRQSLAPGLIPVEVARIALDPGHGGVDGGTSMAYGLLEKDLALDIATRLSGLLTAASWGVVLTRVGDDAVSLKQRASIANASHSDLFLSIHLNWLPDRSARGFETYYLGPAEDPFLSKLAAAENRDSGFALADYRQLLQGIYADIRHDQSRGLALCLQRRLVDMLREENPAIVSRGVMTAPFAVLVATEMPAVLVEVACLSNDREARLLALPSYRQRIADALFAGVVDFASSVNAPAPETQKGTVQ